MAEQRANEQRTKAEQLAQSLWKQSVDLVGRIHERVLPLAGGLEARRMLADTAVMQLEALAKDQTLSPEQEEDLANAYAKLASTFGGARFANQGDSESARRLHQRALGIRERLASEYADSRKFGLRLGESLVHIADLDRLAGQSRAAVQGYERAIPLFEGAIDDEEHGERAALLLVAAEESLTACRSNLGTAGPSEAELEANLARRRDIAVRHPSPLTRRMLTSGLLDTGDRLLTGGDAGTALTRFDEAIAVRRELRASAKGPGREDHDLANALLCRSRALIALKRPAEAVDAAKEGLALMEALVGAEPDTADIRHRRTLADAHRHVGAAHAAVGDPKAAAAEFEAAAAGFAAVLERSTQDALSRRRQVWSLLGLGEALLAADERGDADDALGRAHSVGLILIGQSGGIEADRLALAKICLLRGEAEAALADDPSLNPEGRTRAREAAARWFAEAARESKAIEHNEEARRLEDRAKAGLAAQR